MSPIVQSGPAKGRWYQGREDAPAAVLPDATVSSSGQSSAFATEDALSIEGALTIDQAPTGTTPTLDVKLQTSKDGSTNWYDVAAFPQQNAAGSYAKVFGPISDYCRWVWTLGGTTPSFKFSIATKKRRGL